jgi:hypothetical protein
MFAVYQTKCVFLDFMDALVSSYNTIYETTVKHLVALFKKYFSFTALIMTTDSGIKFGIKEGG